MRYILTSTFVLFLACTSLFSQSWYKLDSGSDEFLSAIFFVDPDLGYSCGTNGTILKTTDGGINWELLNSGTTLPLGDVHFINADTGFVTGGTWNGEGVVLRTIDGGDTWSTSATCSNLITSVTFINESEGIYTGGYGCGTGVARSTNTGETWSSVNNPSSHIWNREVFFASEDIGYIVGSYEKFIKTTDGGKTWAGSLDMSKGMYRGVYFTSIDTGYVTGAAGVKKTTDGGTSWEIVLPAINGSQVKFASSQVGFAMDNLDLYKTTDAGDTWFVEETGTNDTVISVFFFDEDFGYACGRNGAILKWMKGCPEPFVDTIQVYDTTYVVVYDTITGNDMDGLVAYYPFNGNANDESGNGRNATVQNATLTMDRFGNENSAFLFDGTSGLEEYISANIGQFDTISFSAWFKSDQPVTMYPNILCYGSTNHLDISLLGNHPTYISTGRMGKISAGADEGGSWALLLVSDEMVTDNEWHHVVACFVPNDSAYFYLDKMKIGSVAYLPNHPSDDLFYIGRQINDNAGLIMHETHFNGSIDDVCVYNRKLEVYEIRKEYSSGIYYDTIPVYDTVHITVSDTAFISVNDTLTTEVFDTTYITETEHISVTDTLIIDAVLTGLNPPDNINTLKVYPNPAKDHIFINTGDYTRMNGYHLKIIDQSGAVVFETLVEEALYEVNLSSWTGTGLYFVQLIDSEGSIIDIRKIVVQ